MRRKTILAAIAVLMTGSSFAFDPFLISGAVWLTEAVGLPVTYLLSCGLAYSPPVRVFGNQEHVYGLDWGSLACHARDVYGMQLALCGGTVEHRLYGLQLGILASGYAVQECPFDEYHFCNTDFCRVYGLQFGTFAAKTATINGAQVSAIYTQADKVHGMQVGLVNKAKKLRGLQVGFFNSAEDGCGIQIGVVNCATEGLATCLPLINFVQ